MRTQAIFKLLRPISALVARQLAHPSGWLGRTVMTRLLNRGNRELITETVDHVPLTPSTRLLDVGFGGGLALQLARQRGVTKLYGVDASRDAVLQLTRASSDWIAGAELALAQGVVEQLPLGDQSVDAVISTNTVYFWKDLAAAFLELRRVLSPGGTLVLGFSGSEKLRSFTTVTRHGFLHHDNQELLDQACHAGFSAVRLLELHGTSTAGDFLLLAKRHNSD